MAQPQNHASVTITNNSLGNLKLVCGDQFSPDAILEGNSIFFMAANHEGYVIYKGTNIQGGPSNCEWLLAWNVPGHSTQVYVDCGAIGSMEAIPIDEIYKRLEASKSSSTAVDAKTNTSATAVIEAIADTPTLGCDFKV